MKKLGTVKNVIHDGAVLVGAPGIPEAELPGPGARVYDQRGAEVGRVARVFGPVRSPYVSLRASSGTDTLGLLGASVYLDPEERPGRKAEKTRGRARTVPERGRRYAGAYRKKGVKEYRRKEKPRKR